MDLDSILNSFKKGNMVNGMRILYLVDFPLDLIGGAEKSALTTIDEMKKRGHDIYLLTPPFLKNNNTGLDEKHIWYYTKSDLNKLAFFQKMCALVLCSKVVKPDVIHAQFSQMGFLLMILKALHLVYGQAKCYFTDRSFMDEYGIKYHMIFKLFARELNAVICTTEKSVERWRELKKEINVKLLYNVLDSDWYKFEPEQMYEIKKSKNVKDNFVVGFAGRYVGWKRWDTVLKYCESLEDANIYIAVALSDPCAGVNGKVSKEVEQYIGKLKKCLKDRLILYVNINEDEMKKFFYLTDVFVLTSENESFGRVLVEAMTKHNVVIGTNSGGVPSVLGDKKFLFEIDDINQIKEIITFYKQNDDEFESCTEYFRFRAEHIFGIAEFGKMLEAIYLNS